MLKGTLKKFKKKVAAECYESSSFSWFVSLYLKSHTFSELKLIVGQKSIVTKSKKSISGFKLRQKMPIGVSVTLRQNFMYNFMDRLLNLALPRIRDFQGLSLKSFDGQGNYSLGLEEQLMFPEIHYDQIDQLRGMDITIVTSANTDQEGFLLLKEFGFPFQNPN